MEIIGLDLHKREPQLCRQQPDGRITHERIATSRAQFTRTFGGLARAHILLEAGPESEWVAAHLEQLGHRVTVARFQRTYPTAPRPPWVSGAPSADRRLSSISRSIRDIRRTDHGKPRWA